jgi:hypothetical protein
MVRTIAFAAAFVLMFAATASDATAQNRPRGSNQQKAVPTVSVYPNPASSRALVDLESVAGVPEKVTVTDLRGEPWIEIIVTAGQKVVELATADLANGVYLVTVITSTKRAEAKLIVQH